MLLDFADKFDESYKEKFLANRPIEERLGIAQLSGKLQYTHCILFKAMLSDK
ncbi:MAG: hypothetical protein QM528_09275 [Phycisphaerales bacterium]|nr:hypothetical protein [Phycisphaerales bacterium]